jgi:hypothetical protein
MAFNAGKWGGLLSQDSAAALTGGPALAGSSAAAQFGAGGIENFQNAINQWRQATQGLSKEEQQMFAPQFMQNLFPSADTALVNRLIGMYEKQMSPEEQKRQLELADKYQTEKGWKSFAFNAMNQGLQNLTRGFAMSMNPYGTMEAAKYAADTIAAAPGLASAAYANMRNPELARPMVNVQQAPTYF